MVSGIVFSLFPPKSNVVRDLSFPIASVNYTKLKDIEEATDVAGVYGTAGNAPAGGDKQGDSIYAAGDTRIPKSLFKMQRRKVFNSTKAKERDERKKKRQRDRNKKQR